MLFYFLFIVCSTVSIVGLSTVVLCLYTRGKYDQILANEIQDNCYVLRKSNNQIPPGITVPKISTQESNITPVFHLKCYSVPAYGINSMDNLYVYMYIIPCESEGWTQVISFGSRLLHSMHHFDRIFLTIYVFE